MEIYGRMELSVYFFIWMRYYHSLFNNNLMMNLIFSANFIIFVDDSIISSILNLWTADFSIIIDYRSGISGDIHLRFLMYCMEGSARILTKMILWKVLW